MKKNKPTPKQNKWKNPFFAHKVLSKGSKNYSIGWEKYINDGHKPQKFYKKGMFAK